MLFISRLKTRNQKLDTCAYQIKKPVHCYHIENISKSLCTLYLIHAHPSIHNAHWMISLDGSPIQILYYGLMGIWCMILKWEDDWAIFSIFRLWWMTLLSLVAGITRLVERRIMNNSINNPKIEYIWMENWKWHSFLEYALIWKLNFWIQ